MRSSLNTTGVLWCALHYPSSFGGWLAYHATVSKGATGVFLSFFYFIPFFDFIKEKEPTSVSHIEIRKKRVEIYRTLYSLLNYIHLMLYSRRDIVCRTQSAASLYRPYTSRHVERERAERKSWQMSSPLAPSSSELSFYIRPSELPAAFLIVF